MLGLVLLYQGALIPVPLALACVTMGFALITGSKRAHRALKINHRAAQRLLIGTAIALCLFTLVLFGLTVADLL